MKNVLRAVIALAGAGILAAIQGAYIIRVDSHPSLLDGPLFPTLTARILACCVVFAAGFIALHYNNNERPVTSAIIRSLFLAMVAAFFGFEWMTFLSRLPAVTDVSLSLALRHGHNFWTPIAVVSALTFLFWLGFRTARTPSK